MLKHNYSVSPNLLQRDFTADYPNSKWVGDITYIPTDYVYKFYRNENGKSRPNPTVQMGLFMDGNGIPLAFRIHSGNANEQKTLKPLEQQNIDDFAHSKFVVCTDAGLSSIENRRFARLFAR